MLPPIPPLLERWVESTLPTLPSRCYLSLPSFKAFFPSGRKFADPLLENLCFRHPKTWAHNLLDVTIALVTVASHVVLYESSSMAIWRGRVRTVEEWGEPSHSNRWISFKVKRVVCSVGALWRWHIHMAMSAMNLWCESFLRNEKRSHVQHAVEMIHQCQPFSYESVWLCDLRNWHHFSLKGVTTDGATNHTTNVSLLLRA